ALLQESTMAALVADLKSHADQETRVKIDFDFAALKPALPYARTVGGPLYRIARGDNPLVAMSSLEGITVAQIPSTPARAAFITAAIVAREYHTAGSDLRTMANDAKSRGYLLAFLLRDVAKDVNDNAALMTWTPPFIRQHQADFVRLVDVAHD